MYMTAKEIEKMCLDPKKIYIVTADNLKNFTCKLYLQTDYCFYFTYDEKIICISKIDYYLQSRIIREVQNESK